MNAPDRWDERLMDRLVDGELSAAESQRLLADLDQAADGWRQCALAFLEAQTWQQELGGLRREVLQKNTSPAARVPSRGGGVSRWNLVWAVAATFLIAFGIGHRLPLGDAEPQGPATVGPAAARSPSDALPLGNVVLEVGDGPAARRIEVPVYPIGQSQSVDDLFATTAVSPRVIRALEDMGHEVRRQQRLVPGRLEDGRRVVIPVEEFQIVPVGRRRYQ